LEGAYHKALKPLWSRGLIVGYGEVDEGAFPSLAIGATQVLFEELWKESQALTVEKALHRVEKILKDNPLFLKEVQKQIKLLPEIKPVAKMKRIIRGKDLYLD
jgi:hypothetical protein